MNRNNYDVSFKVITIGNSGVGKTSILERFVYNRFNENTMSTVGLNNITKNITLKNGDIIQLKLFDTADKKNFILYQNHILKIQMQYYLFMLLMID